MLFIGCRELKDVVRLTDLGFFRLAVSGLVPLANERGDFVGAEASARSQTHADPPGLCGEPATSGYGMCHAAGVEVRQWEED